MEVAGPLGTPLGLATSPDSHFAFLHFFSMGMVLIPVSWTMSRTSVHIRPGPTPWISTSRGIWALGEPTMKLEPRLSL